MSNITPSGYIYGRDPKQTNPFWDIEKPDEKLLQDRRWLGIEDFPENYSLTIDISKVENKTNYVQEIRNALYQKEIDYLTIENSTKDTNANYPSPSTSGKVYTLKNSTINELYKVQQNGGFHKTVIENCKSSGSYIMIGVSSNPTHILEINSSLTYGGLIPSLRCSSTGVFPDICVILKTGESSRIYGLYSKEVKNIIYSQMTFFVEDEKLQTYLSNSSWSQLSSQIRPLSEFNEEDW